jgi:hypothetical protein
MLPSFPAKQGAPFAALPRSAVALVNSSSFGSVTLRRLCRGFDTAFACRAHVPRYASEGLEPAALAEAREDAAALAAEYAAAAADTLPPPQRLGPPREPTPQKRRGDAAQPQRVTADAPA